jgi:hypothetical protein
MDRYDLLSDSNNSLIILNNDLSFGVSDTQHIEDTINSAQGWWKENFTDGVNIRIYLNSSGQEQVLARSIKIQLESDLYNVSNPIVKYTSDGKLSINPGATI